MALAYRVESRPVGDTGTLKPFAIARCASCEHDGAIAMQGNANNPEAVGKKFRAEGWEFDAFRKSGATCPACMSKRAALRRGESPKSAESVMSTTKPFLVNGGGAAAGSVTFEQRQKVKELLTGTFDEKLGHYLDANSDQRVAAECGVPMIVVREMREMWLGPIKAVPELAPLADQIAAIEERVTGQEREVTDLKASVVILKQKLDAELRRLGVAA